MDAWGHRADHAQIVPQASDARKASEGAAVFAPRVVLRRD